MVLGNQVIKDTFAKRDIWLQFLWYWHRARIVSEKDKSRMTPTHSHFSYMSVPHAFGDFAFFFAEGGGIDRGGFHTGVPHPFLEHMQLHAASVSMHAKAVAQTFWAGLLARYVCMVHHLFHVAVSAGARDRNSIISHIHTLRG